MTRLLAVHADRPLTWPDVTLAVASMMLLLLYHLARLVYLLRAENERRETLVRIVQDVPLGTKIVQSAGPAGPALHVQVGQVDQNLRALPPSPTIKLSAVREPVSGGGRGRSGFPGGTRRRAG